MARVAQPLKTLPRRSLTRLDHESKLLCIDRQSQCGDDLDRQSQSEAAGRPGRAA